MAAKDTGVMPKNISTTVLKVGGTDFLISHIIEGVLTDDERPKPGVLGSVNGPDYLPATLINWHHQSMDEVELRSLIAGFVARGDDVWTRDFLTVIILCVAQPLFHMPKTYDLSILVSTASQFPDGPYALHPRSGRVHRIFKLVNDDHHAFVGTCTELDSASRLPEKFGWRFCDLRFAVKDIIDVAGLETGCGNLAYRSLSSRKEKHAKFITQMLLSGAILLGKTKTTQFADGQDPSEWFDYKPPLNPRGDGFQKPSSSSTGSATACAAYPWLDFTIGTDTGGSIRHPAGVNGVYGFRTSLGLVDSTGVFSVTKRLDTIGVFARSASILEAASIALSDPKPTTKPTAKAPKYKLLYPQRAKGTKPEQSLRWFPYANEPGKAAAAETQLEMFVQKLESFLSCKRTPFNLDELWRDTRPENQPDTLDAATGSIYTRLVYYSTLKKNIDPFIKEYKAKNEGRAPWIDSVIRARFDAARKDISKEDYDEALKKADMFGDWVDEVLFKQSSEDEVPLLIFPQSFGQPEYRDDNASRKGDKLFWDSFSVYSLSYLGGGPDATVPIAEVPFVSRHTGIEEWLPVSMSILGKKGSDAALLSLLKDMEVVGTLNAVGTGRRLFEKRSIA